jgi:hypothetical protein
VTALVVPGRTCEPRPAAFAVRQAAFKSVSVPMTHSTPFYKNGQDFIIQYACFHIMKSSCNDTVTFFQHAAVKDTIEQADAPDK